LLYETIKIDIFIRTIIFSYMKLIKIDIFTQNIIFR